MSTLKLYTEYQVREMLSIYVEFTDDTPNCDSILDEYTPILLPTDEEIEESAKEFVVIKWEYAQDENKESFIKGVKFVIDKIKGGSK